MEKMYWFSTAKHAHDIELYSNHLYNTLQDMYNRDIPYDETRYSKMHDMYYGPLMSIRIAMSGANGHAIKLTGTQIALTKKIILWAAEFRFGCGR